MLQYALNASTLVIQHRNDKSKGSIVASMLVSTVGVMGFVLILKFASLSRRLDEETEKGERRGQMMGSFFVVMEWYLF